jgi:hypothetical protein
VRIVGRPPLEATVFEMQRLRCNACGQIFAPDPPPAAGEDKYDQTAIAMLALLKYGTGIPFHRLENCSISSAYRCRRLRNGSCWKLPHKRTGPRGTSTSGKRHRAA